MKLIDLVDQYVNEDITALETIRVLSGVFNPDNAIDLLAIINQICRVDSGDLPKELFIKLIRGE